MYLNVPLAECSAQLLRIHGMVVLLLVAGPNERDEELLKKVCLYASWDDPVKLEISVPLRGS